MPIVPWPLQRIPLDDDGQIHRHGDFIATPGSDNPWRQANDRFSEGATGLPERDYAEFVNFLPYVQRVL